MSERPRIVIVGGGTGGITVSARLLHEDPKLDVSIIEPSTKHYYQPLWTLVGGGVFPREESEREEASLIPRGATWVRDRVAEFTPESNTVTTESGTVLGYDYLVVAAGLQINWDKIEGLRDAVGHDGVCSNYDFQTVDSTWKSIREFQGGTAIFTQPSGAVKCGGAPQKIMYLADEAFRRKGVRGRSRILFAFSGNRIFAVEPYATTLEGVVERKQIETLFKHELIAIRAASKQAVFRRVESGEEVVLSYDMIHVTPPMGPPDFVARSPLADRDGWIDVDKYTLQHVRFSNIFGIGDVTNLPTSKTGAAIRKQAPVLVDNLFATLKGVIPGSRYDGYSSCPLVTGYNSLVLAEFDYDKKPAESFPWDQSRERFSSYLLKKTMLPAIYWHGMLRGRI